MGKGDKRTRRGKIWAKSYGKSRPHKDVSAKGANVAGKEAAAKARGKSAGAAAAKPRPKPAAAPAARDNEPTAA